MLVLNSLQLIFETLAYRYITQGVNLRNKPIAPKRPTANSFRESKKMASFLHIFMIEMDCRELIDRVAENIIASSDHEIALITVTSLAERFGVDRFKLARKFKHFKNTRLDQYINQEKMTRAAFLLVSPDEITIKEIAQRLGFCTAEYFSRVFNNYYGVSPCKYREYKQELLKRDDHRTGQSNRRQKKINRKPIHEERRRGPGERRQSKPEPDESAPSLTIQQLLKRMKQPED